MNKCHLTKATPPKKRKTRENNYLKDWQKVKLNEQSNQLLSQLKRLRQGIINITSYTAK